MSYTSTRYRNVYYRGRTLYYRFKDEGGTWVEKRYGEGKPSDADSARSDAQKLADAIREGVTDHRKVALFNEAKFSIERHVQAWAGHLESKGCSKHHVKVMMGWVKAWAKETETPTAAMGTAESAVRWLSAHPKWSARTWNYARRAIISFYRWAEDYNKIARSPMRAGLIPKKNERADRRRVVESMPPEMFGKLLASVPSTRKAFYLVCAMTGLRWTETSRLLWSNVRLMEGTLIVSAGQSKNGREAELPLPETVAEALRKIRPKNVSPSAKVFEGKVCRRTWNLDLEYAGIGNASTWTPRCLRLTFGTWLKQSGVDLRDAQRFLRHSDPKLTANLYTDIRMADLRRASDVVDGAVSTAFQQADQDEVKKTLLRRGRSVAG